MPRTPSGRPRRSPYTRRGLGWAAALAAAFAVLAGVVLTRHGTPYPLDTGPIDWSVRHRPHGWLTAARVVTHAGTGPYPFVAAALGGWLGGSRGRMARARAGVPVALLAVVALVAEQAVRGAVMVAADRARPPVADWAVAASGHSFPSGHTSSSAMAAGLLAWGALRAARGRRAASPPPCAWRRRSRWAAPGSTWACTGRRTCSAAGCTRAGACCWRCRR